MCMYASIKMSAARIESLRSTTAELDASFFCEVREAHGQDRGWVTCRSAGWKREQERRNTGCTTLFKLSTNVYLAYGPGTVRSQRKGGEPVQWKGSIRG